MSFALRSLVFAAAACSVALVAGCDSTSYASTSGASSVSTSGTGGTGTGGSSTAGGYGSSASGIRGTHNSIVATPGSNLFSVEVGMKQTISVTFTSSDGHTITGFGLTNTTLPPGWTGPRIFGCQTVNTGSGCVLNLTYAPTAYEVGKSVTLSYLYVDNSGTPVTSATAGAAITTSFNYQGTTDDNITNTVSPSGQINATIGSGQQSVTVTFLTDDGHPASNLAITPAVLPAGWTAPSPASCATVSAGIACSLTWVYQPLAPDRGTLTPTYTYNDDSGTAKTASFNIPYAATSNNSISGTANPSPLAATVGGAPTTVTVSFVTDDGFSASDLAIVEDLSMLAASNPGWSSASPTFSCALIDGVTTTCSMTLSYAPTVPGSGTLQLHFNYTNNAGTALTNSFSIPYTATANDTVSGTANPGTLAVASGGASTPVTVTFVTNDGFAASALHVVENLSTLAASNPGWSAAGSTFNCAVVDGGTSTCRLSLSYAPTVPGSGTLQLHFNYTNNAGTALSNSVSIPYSAT